MEQSESSAQSVTPDSSQSESNAGNRRQETKSNVDSDRGKDFSQRTGFKSVQTETQTKNTQAKDHEVDDEFEEIKIGSVTGKVPKQVAKAVKDLERGVQKKFQEFSQREKTIVAQVINEFKRNPRGFFQHTGLDPEEFAEATLAEKIEMLQMSPEQKRMKELEHENRKFKEDHETTKKQKEEEQRSKEETEQVKVLDSEITEAWKESQLPHDLFYVKQIAAIMRDSDYLAGQGKLERPLTAKQAASIVKQRFENSIPQIMTQMDPQGILKLIGEENFSRLRKWDLDRVTGKVPPTVNSATRPGHEPASQNQAAKKRVFTTDAEWRKYNESLAR